MALLAFKESGNGLGLDDWVEGGDPCADRWVGVCCREGGWLTDSTCPVEGSGTGVVTGLRLQGLYFSEARGDTCSHDTTTSSSCALYALTGDVRLLSPLNTTLVTFSFYDLAALRAAPRSWRVEAQGGCVMQQEYYSNGNARTGYCSCGG